MILVFLFAAAASAHCSECEGRPEKKVNLDQWSTRSLLSPDQRWKLLSVGPRSTEKKAPLYILNSADSKKWLVGWIERNGTAFWSADSKRLFLRDEYAADDTKIRVFDATGSVPKEITGLDDKIQKALLARIPRNETTQWLYYPEVCFAAHDSSTIIVIADAPLVLRNGGGSGKPFDVKLSVNVVIGQVVSSEPISR